MNDMIMKELRMMKERDKDNIMAGKGGSWQVRDETGSGTLYIWLKYKDQQNSYSIRCRKFSTNHFSVSTGRKCYPVT